MKFVGRLALAIIITLATNTLSGCGSSTSMSMLPAGQLFTGVPQIANNRLDLIFVIDNQPSMSSFQASLVASFATFMSIFQNKGFDFKIAVVTTDAYMADPTLNGYVSSNAPLAQFNNCSGTTCSGVPVLLPTDPNLNSDFAINAKPNKDTAGQDARSFSSLRYALQTPDPVNAGFIRSNSFVAVVIVDNTDDFSDNTRCSKCNLNLQYKDPNLDPISTYITFLNNVTASSGATARYNVSAMTQIATPCQAGTNMTRIMSLVNQTNGVLGDICQTNYGTSMATIASQISTLATQYYLNRVPDPNTIVVTINGVTVPKSNVNGWQYNSTANSIMFYGSAVPTTGSSVSVTFTPTTILGP